MAVAPSCIKIDLSRDSLFNDFTLQTLKERYLINGETSPQQAFARAAAAFADDEEHAQRLYNYVSNLWFMFATPLLSNGGSKRGLPISCFLNVAEDSRAGIFDHWEETGWLSSVGGGVGGYWGKLRGAGEKTSRGSSSTGVIPFIATVDRLILSVSQGGTRRGSYAAYLDISHPEIEEFITMRKPTGGDQNRKATNLHNAVNITDEFMEAVRDDAPFSLRSPNTGEVMKTVKARDLWRLLIETRMQTGEPYMVFIDTINRALPQAQKNLGLKVNQSNLCVTPYTEILTEGGYKPIGSLEGQNVRVWNGREYSEVKIERTAEQAELVRVWMSDGGYLDCTPQHNFYLDDGSKVPAAALKNGDVLEGHVRRGESLRNPQTAKEVGSEWRAFAAGFATVAGFEDNNRLTIIVPSNIDDLYLRVLAYLSVDLHDDGQYTTIRYEPSVLKAGQVPFHLGYNERNFWLQGALAARGEAYEGGLQIGSLDDNLIREMRLLALEMGLNPEVRFGQTMNVFRLNEAEYMALLSRSMGDEDLKISVKDVHPLPFQMATFCATEPRRGRLCFNGYITGNCTEITLPTGIDHLGKMRTAVCCLSSVNAEKYDEWKDDPNFIEDLMRMLDNALDVFIAEAPDKLEAAIYSAGRERSVGLGLLGFQAYLQKHGIAMEHHDARVLNRRIFKHLKRQADAASKKLGIERGEAPDMAGTGERFAHKLAIAPNASSSIICGGTSPSIEPHRANAYLHKTLSGSFPVKNKYLVEALQKLGMDNDDVWRSIIANEGSVQHLNLPQQVKMVFKTATEIDQMALVNLASDRAPMICQAQSLNLFFEAGTDAERLTEAHYRAWELGVKSLYYLRSTTPKRAENTNEKVERVVTVSAPVEDEGCVSCEG